MCFALHFVKCGWSRFVYFEGLNLLLSFQNEEILKKTTSDYQEKLKRSEEKYRMLKKHAEEKIERFVLNEFLNDERTISFYFESVWSNNRNQNTDIFLFWNKNSEITLFK